MANVKISDMSAAATLDGTEQVELNQGGSTVRTTTAAIRNAGVKVYRALLTQSGTNAPVATVLENTLGGTPVWSYNGPGDYSLTLANAFPSNKTIITAGFLITNLSNDGYALYCYPSVSSLEYIVESAAGSQADGVLNNTPIQILVYP